MSVFVPQLFNSQAQSLLLMTSVAMPVFSKKQETVSIIFLITINTIIHNKPFPKIV